MTLQRELESFKAQFGKNASDEKKRTYEEFIERLGGSGLVSQALQEGQQAVDFTLLNAEEKPITLSRLLEQGPVILTWYRGGWCPYCNLTLRALQQHLPKFAEFEATLVALTPEKPDKSLTTKEKHGLEFEVLTDLHNEVARRYGIVFQVPPEVMVYYNQNFDLHDFNGDASNELPLSAAYLIDTQNVIRYAYLRADYRTRAEPEALVSALKQMHS